LDCSHTGEAYGLTSDQTIELTGTKASNCTIPLRRIGFKDAETGFQYYFLTNNFMLSASTITEIYKARWQIVLFIKKTLPRLFDPIQCHFYITVSRVSRLPTVSSP
jgi:hypothetical protein